MRTRRRWFAGVLAASQAVTAHTSNPAVRCGFRAGDLQACHAEQRRRRILEHAAGGFLLMLKSVGGPKIVGAAGFPVTAARL